MTSKRSIFCERGEQSQVNLSFAEPSKNNKSNFLKKNTRKFERVCFCRAKIIEINFEKGVMTSSEK